MRQETDMQIQEGKKGSNKMNSKRSTTRHIVIKMAKIKIRENIKSNRGKTKSYSTRGLP